MSDECERAWAELERLAQRLLEHPRELEPREPIRNYGSLLRLWHYPAFGLQRTWTLCLPGRKAAPGAAPLVREVAWDRRVDQQRLFGPGAGDSGALYVRPSLGLRDAFLPAAEVQLFLEEGARLAVPVVGFTERTGLDGDFYGIETYEVSPNVRLQWWQEGPVEWRHFTDWAAGLRGLFMRHLEGEKEEGGSLFG
jgi:hypothetical protein